MNTNARPYTNGRGRLGGIDCRVASQRSDLLPLTSALRPPTSILQPPDCSAASLSGRTVTEPSRSGEGRTGAEEERRAERCIGLAIRRGQEEGRIAKRGDKGASAGSALKGGKPEGRRGDHLVSSGRFFGNRSEQLETYAMTDGVTDADFDSAIEEAKAEGNPSRANTSCRGRGVPARRLLEGRHRGTNSRVLVGRNRGGSCEISAGFTGT